MMLPSFLSVVAVKIVHIGDMLSVVYFSIPTTYYRRLTRHDLDLIRRRHPRLLRPLNR